MGSLPSAGSGSGGFSLLQSGMSGMLPEISSQSALALSSLSSATPVPAADTNDAPATIQTVQPTSFAPAALGPKREGSKSTKETMAALVQKRKEMKAKKEQRAKDAMAPKGTIDKQRKNQTRAAAAPGEKKAPVGPWTKEEDAMLKKLVDEQGEGKWDAKASTMGTGRTSKAVHTRWLRAKGRIIDVPRGCNMNHEMTSMDAERQAKIMDESAYLLPVLTGSLGAAFGQSSVPK